MADESIIKLFEGKQVRIVWNEQEEKYYFSVVDIVQVLTDTVNPTDYIKKMKARDKELAKGWGQIVTPLAYQTSGGKQKINFADLEGIFRLIQSIPSKKAEPVKQWLAKLGEQRIDQMIDPELTFQMAVDDYRHKGLTKENLRDNMTNIELALNTLAEVATTEISRQRNPKGMGASKQAAKAGGQIAKNTRDDLERQLGRSVISSQKASDYIRPVEDGEAKELPFEGEDSK